jgi:hypothetical protein
VAFRPTHAQHAPPAKPASVHDVLPKNIEMNYNTDKVIILRDKKVENEEELAWNKMVIQQFLNGYDEKDSFYDVG